MLKGFKEFISRGNVVELAVGVIIGAAFKNIVDALVDGIINPLIAAVIGKPDFSDAFILTLNGTDVKFGVLITAVINFLLMAFAIYFCIVVPMNALNARRKKDADETPKEVSEEVQPPTELRDALASCASAPLPPGGDPEGIAEALAEASRSGGDSWRLLISRDDDGPYTVATVRQLLSTRDASSTIDLETWDGGQSGPSLVAGCAS